MDEKFQTRNEAGQLAHFSSVQDAVNAYKNDKTIWKISVDGVRWIVKLKHNDFWGFSDFENQAIENHLKKLSPSYGKQDDDDENVLFFVRKNFEALPKKLKAQENITKEEYDIYQCTLGIEQVLSEQEFITKFKNPV